MLRKNLIVTKLRILKSTLQELFLYQLRNPPEFGDTV